MDRWMKGICTLGMVLLWVAPSPSALAQIRLQRAVDEVQFDDEVEETDVSGSPAATGPNSQVTRLATGDGTTYGLYGARFAERGDEPCHVVGLFENIRDIEDDRRRTWSECGSSGPNNGSNTSAGFGDVGVLDKRGFITSVQACVNDGDKLKGLRVDGVRIRRRGSLGEIDPRGLRLGIAGPFSSPFSPNKDEPEYDSFRRAHCDSEDWREEVSCSPGFVATALNIHHIANGSKRQVAGLSLECRQVLRPIRLRPAGEPRPRRPRVSDDREFTPISGYSGEDTESLQVGNGADNFNRSALTGIFIRESLDRPCQIILFGEDIRGGSAGKGTVDLELCSTALGIRNWTKPVVSFDAPRFVRGLTVCTTDKRNSRSNKLKGLRILPARVDPVTGEIINEDNEEEFRLQNCGEWHDRVTCPANQIGTGLRVHYNGKSIRGLELQCAAIE